MNSSVDDYPRVFRGEPKKMRIVSNNICYGPPPEPDEEVEQHLTINSEGRIWFSTYTFCVTSGKYRKSRMIRFKISKESATSLLDSVATYFASEYIEVFATDIGDWVLELTNTDDEEYFFRGSLCAKCILNDVDLSDMIRRKLDMQELYLFDGNNGTAHIDNTDIVETMKKSEGCRIMYVDKNGTSWTGLVDVYETAYDNEDDEYKGDSICVERDDGCNVIIYANELTHISILEGIEENNPQSHKCPVCDQYIFTHKGSHDICEICGWQDDIIQELNPEEECCANIMSLNQAKAAFKNGKKIE